MEERKLNRNALRSKALIREAFFTLLKTKDINSISVTDLVKTANINRATFYAHYSCIADLCKEIEDEIIKKLLEILSEFSFENFFKNPSLLLMEVSKFLDCNSENYRIILNKTEAYCFSFVQRLTDIFIQYLKNDKSVPDSIKNDKSFDFKLQYTAGGISSMYYAWLRGTLNCSIYDLPIQLGKILTNQAID